MGSEYKTITRNGKRKPAHVVLTEEFLGRPLRENEVVHHINGEKDDNRLANLQVMDRAEHTRLHASGVTPNAETLEKLSRSHKGKPSANRKLTEEQVRGIAEMLRDGISARKIAEKFPVSVPSIVSIRDGKAYRDFLGDYADSDFPLQEKKRGRVNRRERKLDPEELGFVRIALTEGESVPVIAKRFGISPSSVRAIRDGLTYREIPWPSEKARLFLTHDMPTIVRILLENPMSEKEGYRALTEDYHLVPNVGTVLALRMIRKAMEGERDLALLLLLTAGYGDWVQQLIRDESILWQTVFTPLKDIKKD